MNIHRLVAFCGTMGIALGCNCTEKILHQHFCEDDFVLAAHILDNEDAPGSDNADRRYSIWILQKMKGLEEKGIMTMDYLYTKATQQDCGIILTLLRTYVISGKIVDGKMWINLCGLSYYGHDLPCPVEVYQDGCRGDCKICSRKKRNKSCLDNGNTCAYKSKDFNDIYSNACIPTGSECAWRECNKMTLLGSSITRVRNNTADD